METFFIHITWLSGGGRAGFPSWSEKCLESAERRLGFLLWLGGGTGVKVFFHGQGFATPAGTKERSFWDFLSAFPDVRQRGMKERYGSKAVSSQTSKSITSDSLLGLLKILFP